MDVHDASADGASDGWIFYGDSITEAGMPHDLGERREPELRPARSSAVRPASSPRTRTAASAARVRRRRVAHRLLAVHLPGRFVGLSYGTNDANGGTSPTKFDDNYVTMVQAVLRRGQGAGDPDDPVGAHRPMCRRAAPALNAKIHRLYADFPQVVHGPDLWVFFRTHPACSRATACIRATPVTSHTASSGPTRWSRTCTGLDGPLGPV